MQQDEYKKMDDFQKTHWWYLGRRFIVKTIFNKYIDKKQRAGSFLDVGCGTGEGASVVGDVGKLVGIDDNKGALSLAKEKGYDELHCGLAEKLPFLNNTFQGVIAFDVLEHVANDGTMLEECFRVLTSPEGILLLTVPAFMWLWSKHDEIAGHKRRYIKKELLEKIKKAGFEIVFASYYVTFLFPLIAVISLLEKKLRNKYTTHFFYTPPIINNFLLMAFSHEAIYLKHGFTLPFGSSIIVVARKK